MASVGKVEKFQPPQGSTLPRPKMWGGEWRRMSDVWDYGRLGTATPTVGIRIKWHLVTTRSIRPNRRISYVFLRRFYRLRFALQTPPRRLNEHPQPWTRDPPPTPCRYALPMRGILRHNYHPPKPLDVRGLLRRLSKRVVAAHFDCTCRTFLILSDDDFNFHKLVARLRRYRCETFSSCNF